MWGGACPPAHCQVRAGQPPSSLAAWASSTALQPGRAEPSQLLALLGILYPPRMKRGGGEVGGKCQIREVEQGLPPPVPLPLASLELVSSPWVRATVEGGGADPPPQVCPGSHQHLVEDERRYVGGFFERIGCWLLITR